MITKLLEHFKDVSMTNGRFFADKSYKYDTVFFGTRYLYDAADSAGLIDLTGTKLNDLTDKFVSDLSLKTEEKSADANKNYILESLAILEYAKVIEKISTNNYKIIDKEIMEYITVCLENAYIFQYILAYKTYQNDGIWSLYSEYCALPIGIAKKEKLDELAEQIINKSASIGKKDSVWAKNVVKFSIMVLGLANNEHKVSRTLNIEEEKITPEMLANEEGTKSTTVKNNFFIHEFKKSYVLNSLKPFLANSSISIVLDEIDPKELILKTYQSHSFDFDDVKKKYEEFNKKFGKDALSSLSDNDTLTRLFGPKEGLTYSLEFDPEYSYFGGIGGGNAFKYPLFFSSDGTWKTGTVKHPVTLAEDEAVQKAIEIKEKLLFLIESVETIGNFDTVDKYAELYELLDDDPMYRRLWVMKYVHMIFYDKFSAYFDVKWTSRLLQCIKETPVGGIYSQSGQLSIIANELSIPNIFMEKVLNELFPPKNDIAEEEEEENAMLPTFSNRLDKTYPLNMILYGAPGTGKTYATAQIAIAILEKKSDSIDDIVSNKISVNREDLMKSYKSYVENGQIVFTTFHQSYGYEDFIQGLRPDDSSEKLSFKPVDGVFKRIAEKALENPNNNYVIIIDEINRGNISKVLGELITLVEEDKRWGEVNALSITLPSGDVFVVPNNLYIVGTMNSADKSISLIDAALRRRFSFVEVSPDSDLVSDSTLKEVLKTINKKLESELESTDLLVGHAYFIGKSKDDLADIMNRSIVPLLYEYFFDNKNKVLNILKEALKDTGFDVEDKIGRRLKVVKA